MPIQRAASFAPSRKAYAIWWDSFDTTSKQNVRMDGTSYIWTESQVMAIWAGRKHGETYVSYGVLRDVGADVDLATPESFMANFDIRHGGDCWCRWNGQDLWATTFTPENVVAHSKMLDDVLQNLPEVPAKYDGWCQLVSS
ncbi:MAG: hypothetical protein ACRCYU_23525 [Nocardioides sp.]